MNAPRGPISRGRHDETQHPVTKGDYFVNIHSRAVWAPGVGPFALDRVSVVQGRLFYARPISASATISYQETWLIPDQNWAITRFTFHEHLRGAPFDWKMEPDSIQVDGAQWRVSDRYLDLVVYDGVRCTLEDADELADALSAGEITLAAGSQALRTLDSLCKALHRLGYAGQALLNEYAPGLPA